jgi:hypothetical protein
VPLLLTATAVDFAPPEDPAQAAADAAADSRLGTSSRVNSAHGLNSNGSRNEGRDGFQSMFGYGGAATGASGIAATFGVNAVQSLQNEQNSQRQEVAKGVWTIHYTTPFWQKNGPAFEKFLDQKNLIAAKALAPYDQAIKDLQTIRAKLADQSSGLGAFRAFIGNPLGLITSAIAATATGGLSLGGDLAKRALDAAGSDQSKAISLIDAQIADQNKKREAEAAKFDYGQRWATLQVLPKGINKVGSDAAKGQTVVGSGPMPRAFVNWFKRRVK